MLCPILTSISFWAKCARARSASALPHAFAAAILAIDLVELADHVPTDLVSVSLLFSMTV